MEKLENLRKVMLKTENVEQTGDVTSTERPENSSGYNVDGMFSYEDPNPNYVLTMDNAKKILAMHQRLRYECEQNPHLLEYKT